MAKIATLVFSPRDVPHDWSTIREESLEFSVQNPEQTADVSECADRIEGEFGRHFGAVSYSHHIDMTYERRGGSDTSLLVHVSNEGVQNDEIINLAKHVQATHVLSVTLDDDRWKFQWLSVH